MVEGKFRSQTSDNMDRWKAEQGRGREKRKIRREKIRRERVRGQKIQMREKVGKSRNTVFFQWFVAPEGRKVGSLKRRVRSQLARWEMKNCTPLWREARFQVKIYKNTSASDHFWKLRCQKSARRCGAKHISKWTCRKHLRCRTTFGSCDVEKVHAVVARSTFPSQKCKKLTVSDHFWRFRCGKSVEKVHAVVARSTFRSQKCKKLRVLSLFWREDVEKVDTE